MILTLDGGTTNTRLYLFEGDRLIDSISRPIGSNRKDNEPLRRAVSDMITTMRRHGSIEAIVASGMVTSELGLYELPHLPAPAGVKELAAGAARVTLPFCDIPFVFIPGIKTNTDMMRGEETECMGLGLTGPCAVVLPGTHNKVILFDGEKITDLMTMLSGEMIAALKDHTILRQSLPERLPNEVNEEQLLAGAAMTKEYGLSAALFRVRSLSKLEHLPQEQLCNFYVGAILQNDAQAIRAFAGDRPVLVGGKEPLRRELCALIPEARPLAQAELAGARGALTIMKKDAC